MGGPPGYSAAPPSYSDTPDQHTPTNMPNNGSTMRLLSSHDDIEHRSYVSLVKPLSIYISPGSKSGFGKSAVHDSCNPNGKQPLDQDETKAKFPPWYATTQGGRDQKLPKR